MKHIRKFNEANIERETLEEAAERATRNESLGWENEYAKEKFIEGAKWQQQRSHSEEEVLELLLKMNEWPTTFDGEDEVREWFEEFKK